MVDRIDLQKIAEELQDLEEKTVSREVEIVDDQDKKQLENPKWTSMMSYSNDTSKN